LRSSQQCFTVFSIRYSRADIPGLLREVPS
jgi:hypothetical protein